jgi:hypothetical protein
MGGVAPGDGQPIQLIEESYITKNLFRRIEYRWILQERPSLDGKMKRKGIP